MANVDGNANFAKPLFEIIQQICSANFKKEHSQQKAPPADCEAWPKNSMCDFVDAVPSAALCVPRMSDCHRNRKV
jgi:hypothetical protein